MLNRKEFQQRAAKIEELVRNLEATADPNVRAAAKELVHALMDLQGACVERMLEIVHATGDTGAALIETFQRDDLVKNLMLLHGLHPVDLQTRVLQALDKTRPLLQSHGGNVELIAIDDAGSVALRLVGSCHGCGASFDTFKTSVEDALYEAAPDIASLSIENAMIEKAPAGAFVSLDQLSSNGNNGHHGHSGGNGHKPASAASSTGDGENNHAETALPVAKLQASGD